MLSVVASFLCGDKSSSLCLSAICYLLSAIGYLLLVFVQDRFAAVPLFHGFVSPLLAFEDELRETVAFFPVFKSILINTPNTVARD